MATSDSLRSLVERIAAAEQLDRVSAPVAAKVHEVVGPGLVKDLLSGTWLGHPLHPVLTDLPIGFWTSSLVVDVVGGRAGRRASRRLIGLGILSALPTAAAGLSDWSDTMGAERRIGTAHAAGNVAALGLYAWSWRARGRGAWVRGVLLGVAGAAAATAGAYLGGHLVYRKGVGADRNAWTTGATEWVDIGPQSDLDDGGRRVVEVGDDRVLVVRQGSEVHAISEVCGHAGGPLSEGEIDDRGCVTCPWHASVFRLGDGTVVHGPATGPQPAYEVKAEGGRLALRRRSSS